MAIHVKVAGFPAKETDFNGFLSFLNLPKVVSKILNKRPKYDVAFYFKCNLKIASKRRWLELKKIPKLSDVKKSLKKRTLLDKNRINSPLKKVKDAFLIRTDKLNKSQVLSKMSSIIENKLKFKN